MPAAVQEQEHNTIQQEIRTAAKHSAVYALGNILAKAVSFLMLPFYTRYLTPEHYGILEILDLSVSILGMILHMGLTPALLRSYAASPNPEEARRAMSTGFWFVVVTAAMVFAAGLAVARPVSTLLFGPQVPPHYLILTFSSLMLSYIANLPRTYLRALEASGALTIIDTVCLVAMLALNVYFIAFAGWGLVGILLSSVIVGVVQTLLLSGWTVSRIGLGYSAAQLRAMLAFGLPLIFSNVSMFVLNFSNRFFLQSFQSLDAVGLYAVGYKFGFMISFFLIQPFYVMWQSRMYFIYRHPEHQKIFGQIFVLYSLVLVYAALALSLLSPEIVRAMVDPKFASSRDVIPLVATSYVFYGIGLYAQVGMFLADRTRLIGVLSAATAVLNLVLNYFLIMHYGMMGAAWATLLSFMAICGITYWWAQRVMWLPMAVGRVTLGALFALAMYGFCRWQDFGGMAITLLIKTALLAAFPLLLWKSRVLSAGEVATLAAARDQVVARASQLIGQFSKGVNP